MGYVYYGNYPTYYEVARVECIRSLGLSYKELEEQGIILPVLEFTIKYVKPAFYDQELTLVTKIEKLPSTRITFKVECFNESQELLNFGTVTLVFVNKETKKPCHPSQDIINALKPYFSEK